MNNKKNGRPKKDDIGNIIKVAVNDETAEALDKTAKEIGKSKSDLLREIIPIVSSKDFEGMITNTPLEQLEKYSNDCWNLIHTRGCLFEVDKLSERMPAYILTFGFPKVCVKYPTFRIQIFNGENPLDSTDQKKLQDLVSGISNISKVYATPADYLIVGDRAEELSFPFVNEIMCLDIKLEDCIRTKDKITALLKENGYNYSVYPAFCVRYDNVELVDDKKYFKVITKDNVQSGE